MQSDAPVQRGREKIHVRNPASYLDLCINNVVGYDSEGDLLVRSGGETLVLSQDLLMFRKIDLSKQLAMGKEGRLLLWTRHTTLGVVCALFFNNRNIKHTTRMINKHKTLLSFRNACLPKRQRKDDGRQVKQCSSCALLVILGSR